MAKRLVEYDILKSIAIFLVIWQHVMNVCGYGLDFINTKIGAIITAVNMPLFIFIVGLFSRSSLKNPFITVLKSKWNTLLLPMSIFCIIQSVISILHIDHLNISELASIQGGVKS